MDSVLSVRFQVQNTVARTSAYNADETKYGTPKPTCRTSAAMVPKTPTIITASQYAQAT